MLTEYQSNNIKYLRNKSKNYPERKKYLYKLKNRFKK